MIQGVSDIDVFTASPENARLAVREELYHLLEESSLRNSDPVPIPYSTLWNLWRTAHLGAQEEDELPPNVVFLITLSAAQFILGFVLAWWWL